MSDPNPLPGLTVSPVHGVVPVGGSTEIRVALTPDSIIKFDTRVQVAIKGGKTLELRIGGTVEPPDVNIDVVSVLNEASGIFFLGLENRHKYLEPNKKM